MDDLVRRISFLNLHLMAAKLACSPLPLLNLVDIVRLPVPLLEHVMEHLALQLTSPPQPSTVVKIA